MNFFTNLFYFFTFIAILWEVTVLADTKKVLNFKERYNKKHEEQESTRTQRHYGVFMFGYIMWNLVGMFTSQWICFLLIFALGMMPKFNKTWIHKIDSTITIFILLFIFLNKYHLHITPLQIFNYLF